MSKQEVVYICLGQSIGYNDQEHYFEEGHEVPQGAHKEYKFAAIEAIEANAGSVDYLWDMMINLDQDIKELSNTLAKIWDEEENPEASAFESWSGDMNFTSEFLSILAQAPVVLDVFLQAAEIRPAFVREIKILEK